MTSLPTQDLDVDAGGPWWQRRAGWFYDAVLAEEIRDHGSRTPVSYALLREELGTLSLPGGLVVAADPYIMKTDAPAFEQRIGSGEVAVVAVRAVVGEGHERVAALVLIAGPQQITQWTVATTAGQDVLSIESIEGDGFFGYGVDAGTGSLGSPEAMKVAGQVLAADEGMLEDPVSAALFADGLGTRSAVVVAPEEGATPIAVCSSGWGDGSYPTWLGLDGDGDVVVAVTDFLVAGDPFVPSVESSEQIEVVQSTATADRPKSALRRLLGF